MALFVVEKDTGVDDLYTRKVGVPQYLPSKQAPNIESLVHYKKYSELLKHINDSGVSEEEKRFLRFGAARHLVFNYSLIADYYAHASEEMQKLMEESALVILDINDAIMNGYVKLSSDIEKIMSETGEKA